jgi:agmatine deiminase
MPAEWEAHECCWMAWAVHCEWADWVPSVKSELDEVICTIAAFESVRLLTPSHELAEARARFAGGNIEIVEAPVDDIWMRDIAPTFARRGKEVVAIDWNFNGWGSTEARPARPGDQIAKSIEAIFGTPRVSVPFVAEGGACITDGEGTLITTRSCLLNPNRNASDVTELFLEREFRRFGIERVIWLAGDHLEPITSGHVDGYVLFDAPGSLIVECPNDEETETAKVRSSDMAALHRTVDAEGRVFAVRSIFAPRKRYRKFRREEMFAASYVNAYLANGAVIAARFGDVERDEAARTTFAKVFPERKVLMLEIDHIAAGGGGIRCLTQPMPVKKVVQ